MARQYQPRRFFRDAPNRFLHQYFSNQNVFGEIDFAALKETQVEPIYEAWLKLSDSQRNEMEGEFQAIDELADETGTKAILDEARWPRDPNTPGEDLANQLVLLDGFHANAFWTFLERPIYLRGALAFHHADTLPESYWRKRKNIPRNAARVNDSAMLELAKRIAEYFHAKQARGGNCQVEPYKRDNRDYFFAYPEDYAQASVEWEDKRFTRRPRHPAFEIIFVYSQAEGTLDIFLTGDRKVVPDLQGIFAEVILETELGPDEKDDRVYDLKGFLTEDFNFVYGPESGIIDVTVNKIRLKKIGSKERITLEADTTHKKRAVYDLLDRLAADIPLTQAVVSQVGITVTFAPDTSGKIPTRGFDITWPNSLRLKYDSRDLVLRRMLADSGIELKSPAKGDAANDDLQQTA